MSDRKNPPAADCAAKLEQEQTIAAGIERGLADVKAGATVPHDAAMAEVDALIDRIVAKNHSKGVPNSLITRGFFAS